MSEHAIIQEILGVWKFHLPPTKYKHNYSLPGHQMHLFLQAPKHYRIAGQNYNVKRGDLVTFYEAEEREVFDRDVPAIYYSVGFLAEDLPPLPPESRVVPYSRAIHRAFKRLYKASRLPETYERKLKMLAALSELLLAVDVSAKRGVAKQGADDPWWLLEGRLRRNHIFRPSLDEVAEMAGCSRTQVVRVCRKTTGMSPIQRLRKMRMEEAWSLLAWSPMNVSQISDHLGYPDLRGFSREFTQYFKKPPSKITPKTYGGGTKPPRQK